MSFIDFLLLDANLPAQIAIALIGLFFLIEIAGLLVGFSLHALMDHSVDIPDADVDADAHIPALSWLGLGKVPFGIWLISYLCMTAIATLVVSFVMLGVGLRPILLATLVIGQPLALIANHYVCSWLATVFPKETTTAVSTKSFVGTKAQIIVGNARRDMPAQAKLYDQHNREHFVFVRPSREDVIIAEGTWILLVARDERGVFEVIEYSQTA